MCLPAVGQMLRYADKAGDLFAIFFESTAPVNFIPGTNGRPIYHPGKGLLNPDQVILPGPHKPVIFGPGPQVEKTVIRSYLGALYQPSGKFALSFQLDGVKS